MATPTGEVFRTDAPNVTTNWRLLRDGAEYGRIYNFANSTFLNIGARAGGMRLYTLNVERFRLLGNATPYTIGSFTGQQKNGSLLLSPNVGNFFSNGGPGPYSMLHLAAGTADNFQALGYRPWMGAGMTITGNRDQAYVGLKFGALDRTDMVVAWSNDVPGQYGPDRFRFLFTNDPNGSATGARSLEGLEGMRLTAVDQNNINVGLGDFYAGNIVDPFNVIEPTERLDVLNGRVRIRRLPSDPEMEGNYKVMVVDASGDPDEHGVVKWVDPATFANGGDCDWTKLNDGTSGPSVPHHVYTAVGTSDDCPDNADAVGIGVDLGSVSPTGKLVVSTNSYANGADIKAFAPASDIRGVNVVTTGAGTATTALNSGMYVTLNGTSVRSTGVVARSDGASYYGWGGIFTSKDNSTYTTGVQGTAEKGAQESIGVFGLCLGDGVQNVGVVGRAEADQASGSKYYGVMGKASLIDTVNQFAYGVYGTAPVVPQSWAIYAQGEQYSSTGSAWQTSDENLKNGY